MPSRVERNMAVKKLNSGGLLRPLLEGEALRSAVRQRKDVNDYRKIPPEDVKRHLNEGWQVHKQVQSHVWVKRSKSADSLLEDRVWRLFHQLGYPQISGRKFQI